MSLKHTPTPPESRAPLLQIGLVLALTCGLRSLAGPSQWEVWVAVRDGVPLYRKHRIAATLASGELIRGLRVAFYASWLKVRYHGAEYTARTWYLRRWDDLDAQRRRDIAAAQNRIARCNDEIAEARSQAHAYYSAAQSILYDSTIQYVSRSVAVTPDASDLRTSHSRTTGILTGIGTSGDGIPGEVVRVVDRVAPARARNLSRQWMEEVRNLDERIVDLQQQRREAVKRRARILARIEADAERLHRFIAGGDSLADWYVCLTDRTPVYDGKRLVRELLRDAVVFGIPNRTYPEWLKVRIEQKWFDARRDAFLSRRAELVNFAVAAASASRMAADYDEQRKILVDRRDVLQSLCLSLKYRYNVRSVPLSSAALPADREPDRGRLYTIITCPAGAEIMIDVSRARRYIRRWNDEIDDLDAQIDRLRRNADAKRLELARRRTRHDRLLRLFSIANPSTRNTPRR